MNEINRLQPFKLSVVFSFYNEEFNLPELIRRTRSVLEEEKSKNTLSSFEFIFVNDASTDKSLQILLDHAKDFPYLRVINLSRRFGGSCGFLAGMQHTSGDAVVYMDSDLQDPPEVLPESPPE